mgnify:CR=1 FL=1
MEPMKTGSFIRNEREKKGLNQKQFAELLCVSPICGIVKVCIDNLKCRFKMTATAHLKEQQKQSSSYRNSSNKHCHGYAIVVMYFDKKYEDYSIYNAEYYVVRLAAPGKIPEGFPPVRQAADTKVSILTAEESSSDDALNIQIVRTAFRYGMTA